MQPQVSIIMPVYNACRFVGQAIDSVLAQSLSSWELIIIDDGSSDDTPMILSTYSDKRIQIYSQHNKGVSAARNVGLSKMKGLYFCFLDADDVLTKNSLLSRVKMFESNPTFSFVDGTVYRMNSDLTGIVSIWSPSYQGSAINRLVKLDGSVFFGPTWMVKNEFEEKYFFNEGLKHGEDLLFYMELSKSGKLYGFTTEVILQYRDTPQSAMKNLHGLEIGYRLLGREIEKLEEIKWLDYLIFQFRWRSFMAKDYLKRFEIVKVLRLLV